jgi:hypothetical protein
VNEVAGLITMANHVSFDDWCDDHDIDHPIDAKLLLCNPYDSITADFKNSVEFQDLFPLI